MRASWRGPRGSEHPRLPLARVALVVFALKAYMLLVLYVFSQRTPLHRGSDAFLYLDRGEDRSGRLAEVERSFLERLTPYDGQFYLDIAERGYRVFKEDSREGSHPEVTGGPEGNYAFFPLLPLLLRGTRAVLGDRGGLALVLLLNVTLSGAAAVGLYVLASRIGVPPWPGVLLLLTFPTAVFQNALDTESIVLFLSIGVALSALDGRELGGAAFGYLAGLTRPQGVLASALWTRWRRWSRGHSSVPSDRRGVAGWRSPGWLLAFLAPAAGVATFSAILALEIHSPLGFLSIQSHWGRGFSPSRLLEEVLTPWSSSGPPFDHLAALLGVGLLPWLWMRLPPALALYGTLCVLMPLSTGTILSFGRFLSVSFPHFLALATLLEGRRVATVVLLGGAIVLGSLVSRGLVGWHFVG